VTRLYQNQGFICALGTSFEVLCALTSLFLDTESSLYQAQTVICALVTCFPLGRGVLCALTSPFLDTESSVL
jgi:hypothetical protein